MKASSLGLSILLDLRGICVAIGAGSRMLRAVAELDYAFLAEYAKVEPGGNLTAVGASYTYLTVKAFPGQHLLSVAGRIRIKVGETPRLLLSVASPNERIRIDTEVQLHAGDDARPYGPNLDTIGLQFALTLMLTLPDPGLYAVNLALDDTFVRHLAFTAQEQSEA